MPAPIHDLPPRYDEVRHFVLTAPRTLMLLNVVSLVPMAAVLLLISAWWTWLATIMPINAATNEVAWWAGVLIALVVILPLHELLHGIAIQIVGHHPRYGMNLSKGVLYATADGALFRRNEYIFVALLPLIGITILSMILLPLVADGWRVVVLLGAVFNAGGAIGDLWSVWMLRPFARRVVIRDEGDGFRIYDAVEIPP
ncbi:MAG: DUF3267 domain-containing protein [Chloroflexota bacterium]|nr:DUF3267 domain-containing protein [Chloroflexota bacterium]